MAIYNYSGINTGGQANDGTGDNIRDAFGKVNSNMDLLFTLGSNNVILADIYNTLTYFQNIINTIPSQVSSAASVAYVDASTASVYSRSIAYTNQATATTQAIVLATTATASSLGVVKIGSGITRASDGTISVSVSDGPSGPSGPSGPASTISGPSGASVSGPSGPSGPASTISGPSGPAGGGGLNNPLSSIFTITNAEASISTTTGALQVTGGVGIGGELHVDKTVHINNVLELTPLTTAPTGVAAGCFAVADRLNWDPASKGTGNAYPVFYDGTVWTALY